MLRRLRFVRCRCVTPVAVLVAGLLAGTLAGVCSAQGQEIDAAASTAHADAKAAANVRLERMLLLLQPSAAQQKALDDLLMAQQTPGNAKFHQWVTAAQFADKFSLSSADAAGVAGWLRSQGFTVAALPASRGWIEFSGTVGQVERAFGAQVTASAGSGQTSITASGPARYQFVGAVSMPAAIAARVQGIASLDGELAAPAATAAVAFAGTPEALVSATALQSATVLTPALAAARLHLDSSEIGSATGAGETIAIPARSNVRAGDFAAFRSSFALPESVLAVDLTAAGPGFDPGRTQEESATMEAVSWAGVAAPGARIVLVPVRSTNATDGLDLALAATIDGGIAHTVSVGYSACERGMSAAHNNWYAALYRLAAAQGIAVVAATGDSGAAACHASGDASPIATGLAVNGLASTPWNTAVGAVAFAAGGSVDGSDLSSWESSAAGYATGGGASAQYATPLWQAASGLPASDPGTVAGHHRYLPDVSLPTGVASSGIRGLAFCFSGDAAASAGCRLVTGGGSAASSAIFAGVAARLAEKYGPQGNLAPNLYALRQAGLGNSTATSAFEDVAEGAAKLPCAMGSPSCDGASSNGAGLKGSGSNSSGEIGFSAAAGYDLASGLGSVNAAELIKKWDSPAPVGTAPVTVVMTTVTSVTYNPSANITLSAKVTSGSGGTVPTGTVQFYDQTVQGDAGTPVTLAAEGTASYVEEGQFTAGGHNIVAQYSGDATYEAAVSQVAVITVEPSPTSTVVTSSTLAPTPGTVFYVNGMVTSTNPGTDPPTGTMTINVDGVSQGSALLTTGSSVTSADVSVTVTTAGSHSIQGIYSGDINYSASISPAITVTVAKAASTTVLGATPSVLTLGVPETFTATVAPLTAVTGTAYVLTGTVSFYDGGTTLLGTVTVSSNTAILTGVTLSDTAAHTITAVYSGDANYSSSTSSQLLLSPNLLPVTVTLVESASVLAPDAPVTLTATVTPVNIPPLTVEQNPSGYVLFYAGSTLISGQVPVLQGIGDTGVASTTVPHLPAGEYVITAHYSGDPTYGPAVSNSLNLASEDFTIGCAVNNITLAQGASMSVVCNVASLGGLTGPIQVACAEQNPPQTGAIACTFSPNIVTTSGGTTLIVVTKGGNVSQNLQPARRPGDPPWPTAGGGVALAFAGLLLSPIGRRARWLKLGGGKMLVLALLLAGFASLGLGCGNTVTLNSNPIGGTPLGEHTLQITAGADVGTVTVTHTAYLTVNVTP